jgi:hypothetical protein
MPLLATDGYGRVYQTLGLSEFDDKSVGYYPQLEESENLYYDEQDPIERKRLAILRSRRRRQAILKRRQRQRKLAELRRRQAILAARKAQQEAIIKEAQARRRMREREIKLARIRASRNPYAEYDQTLVGNPLAGWEEGIPITSSNDWKKLNLPKVQKSTEFGIGNYYQVEHPLAGFGYIPSDQIDGTMGFIRIRLPRISLPRISVPQIRLPRFSPPRISLPRFSFPQIRLPRFSPPRLSLPRITLPQIRLPQIKVPTIGQVVHQISKNAGTILNAPLQLTKQVVNNVPGIREVYRGVDRLTGGTLTSLQNTIMLPGRALQGQPISKAEFMESLSNVIKVGAIAVTGGAAASVIGATSSALAKGPIGQTPLGRNLLSVGEIASLSSLGNQSLIKVLEKKAVDEARNYAASEAGKKAGIIGSIAASAATGALAKGASAGLNIATKEIPIKASAQSASEFAKVAQQAGNQAVNNATQAIKNAVVKFDSAAAQEEFIKSAQTQARREVEKEFQKRTGLPLDVALKASRGEIPTRQELYDKVKNEFYGKISDLENRLSQIPRQISDAEPLMKKLLQEKSEMLAKEIADRKNLVKKVQQETAEQLAKANNELREKGAVAMAKQSVLAELGKQHDILSQKIKNANLDVRAKLTTEMAALQERILKARQERDKAVDEAEKAARAAEYEKEKGAVLVLQAEYGGPNAREKYLGSSDLESYEHPMLRYGLIKRI